MKNFLLVSLACAASAFAAGPEPDVTPRLYRMKCAGCHGADGSGGVGANLQGKLDHDRLLKVIKNGIPGTEMPASGLSDSQVKKMAAYVLTFSRKKPQ